VVLTIGGVVQPAVIADASGNWTVTGLPAFTEGEVATFKWTATGLPDPTITPDGGTFTGPITVTLIYPGGISNYIAVCYTTDGSNPETSDTCTIYTGPFTVDQSETVQAAYCASGGATGNSSNVVSANFVINSTPTTQPTYQDNGSTPTAIQVPTAIYTTMGGINAPFETTIYAGPGDSSVSGKAQAGTEVSLVTPTHYYRSVIADASGNWTVADLTATDGAEIASQSDPFDWNVYELPAFPGSHYTGGTIAFQTPDTTQLWQYQHTQQNNHSQA
jgi:hypothetical protein